MCASSQLIFSGATALVALIGVPISLYIYYQNSKLARCQLLYSLFEKFFYDRRYGEVRAILDGGDKEDLEKLRVAVTKGNNSELEEKLVDYLNFFEFIAISKNLKQLRLPEIIGMFNYHITRLNEYDFIKEYLKKVSFEGLEKLIKEISARDKGA